MTWVSKSVFSLSPVLVKTSSSLLSVARGRCELVCTWMNVVKIDEGLPWDSSQESGLGNRVGGFPWALRKVWRVGLWGGMEGLGIMGTECEAV